MRVLRLRRSPRLRLAVEVRNEMRIVHQAQKEKDMTQDERIAVIIGEYPSRVTALMGDMVKPKNGQKK